MRKTVSVAAAFVFAAVLAAGAFAQEAPGLSALSGFSPPGEIYVHGLGMADRNRNGVIDQGAGEGYEEFTAKYGNADIGFTANGVIYGAGDGRLEETEIVNHYYIHIRFKNAEETETVERGASAYIYANNIPPVWLDDRQGTVMKAVNGVLGEGWNEREVTEEEALRMFNRTMEKLSIRGRFGDPAKTGYYTLPEFITRRAGYCFEVAAFGFFFFSELRLNAVTLRAALTNDLVHEIVELTNSKSKIDYFRISNGYANPQWRVINPLQSMSQYYSALGQKTGELIYFEKTLLYDKYAIAGFGNLMAWHHNTSGDYHEIIALGELFLKQNGADITGLITSRQTDASLLRQQVKIVLILMLVSYVQTENHAGYTGVKDLLLRHYHKDTEAQQYLRDYALGI